MGTKTVAIWGCVLLVALLIALSALVYINRDGFHMFAMLREYRGEKPGPLDALFDRIDLFERIDPTVAGPLQYTYWQHEMGRGFVGMDKSELLELFGPPCPDKFSGPDGWVEEVEEDGAPKAYDEFLHYGEDNHARDHHVGDETENLFFFLHKGKVVAVKTLFP